MPEFPFQSVLPVILVLSTATMAYIHYNYDRFLKINDVITDKLEKLGEEDSNKSIMNQSARTKNLYDNVLNNIPPIVIGWWTTGLLFLVFFIIAIGEIGVIATSIINPEYSFVIWQVGSVLISQIILIIISMIISLKRLRAMGNFIIKRKNNYDNVKDQIEMIQDYNSASTLQEK